MQAGNVNYRREADLPHTTRVFPLQAALLLPGGRMPLNIFEPRYLRMIDEALAGDRLVVMVQPRLDGALREDGEPELCDVGCVGRIISVADLPRLRKPCQADGDVMHYQCCKRPDH